MVHKTCNGPVSVLENRNFNESLVTKFILRRNNNRYTSETSFHSTHKNESRKLNQINTLSTLGMREIERGENMLKLFAILNLGKPVSHVT